MIRARGQFGNSRYCGIEINKASQLNLFAYSRIYSIDHLIKNCRMKYRCWKYLHSPMIHAMYLAVVVAYDIYPGVVDVEI